MAFIGLQNWQQRTESRDGGTSQHYQRTDSDVGITRIAPISSLKTPPRNPNPERKEWRSESDLEAQWNMAEWTSAAAIAAWFGIIITIIGVILVKQTLEANRAAVKAAEDAVGIARDTAKRELRAYIAVEGAGELKLEAGKPIKTPFKIRNVGQTPAHEVTVGTGCCIRTPNWEGPDWVQVEKIDPKEPRILLMPQASYGFDIDSSDPANNWVPDAENVEKIKRGEQCAFLFGQINYIDSISFEPRYTRFQYEINPTALRARKLMLSASGNTAT